MAIKRIVPKFERKAKICLKCGAKLKRVRNNEAVKCEKLWNSASDQIH